jgi:hypothetical protein
MFGKQSKRQTGFALLIFLVVMMGLGGIALTGFSQKVIKAVEKSRFEYNKDVLQQAKNALLMFAYNYPVTHSGQGPGRLPCPYNQIPIGAGSGYSGSISDAICEAVGRLPWGHTNLELPEFKDADGEHLWYAVSKDFDNNATLIINSDTKGTISIKDQTGNIIYDGAVAGIAAVIIAPGSAIKIDDDDNGSLNYQQVRNRNDPTDPVNFESKNFLDSAYGGTALTENNFSFINPINPSDPLNGFILGPILDSNNNLLMNDQIIIIRAEEVIAMAEKATLQAYKEAIADYQSGAKANTTYYPWLNSYVQITDLNVYDVDPATSSNSGRIPSIFSNYFTDENSESAFSDIKLTYQLAITVDEIVGSYLEAFDNIYNLPSGSIVSGRSEISFSDVSAGQLIGSNNTTTSGSDLLTRFFWDEEVAPDGWEVCTPIKTGTVNDCNQSLPGIFVANPSVNPNLVTNRIRQVTLKTGIDYSGSNITFDLVYPLLSEGYDPPDSFKHAKITAEFQTGVVPAPVDFAYYYFEQDNSYATVFNPADLTAPKNGTTGKVAVAATVGNFDELEIELDYFPELPAWAGETGNNWNSSIMMAYADGYQPQSGGTPTCTAGTDCLTVLNSASAMDNKKAILVLASDHDFVDEDSSSFANDLNDIFDVENDDLIQNNIFDKRADSGDDVILILDQF